MDVQWRKLHHLPANRKKQKYPKTIIINNSFLTCYPWAYLNWRHNEKSHVLLVIWKKYMRIFDPTYAAVLDNFSFVILNCFSDLIIVPRIFFPCIASSLSNLLYLHVWVDICIFSGWNAMEGYSPQYSVNIWVFLLGIFVSIFFTYLDYHHHHHDLRDDFQQTSVQ